MFRVVQLTDTHLRPDRRPSMPPRDFADGVHLLTGRTTDEMASAIVDEVLADSAENGPVGLVVHTGDIADTPTSAAYRAAQELLERLGAPILVTPGNHDDPQLLSEQFGDAAAVTTAHVDLGGWRVVLVSSHWPGQAGGHFDEGTLAELDEALDCDLPILIGTHHPPLSPCTYPDCVVTDSTRFLEVIDRRASVVAVATGHLHLADELERHGVTYLLGPSTALQLRHLHPLAAHNREATPTGARIIDLYEDGSFKSSLIWA